MSEFGLSSLVAVIALASLGAGLTAALRSAFEAGRPAEPTHPARARPVIRLRKLPR